VELLQAGALAGAGVVAGTVNTIAGAGSLLTFPALLAAGLPPLSANVTNCLGMVPGGISGAYGMRDQLQGQRATVLRWCLWAAVGSLLGAGLLLALPSSAFDRIVPVLVGAAGVLVLLQPVVVRRTRRANGHVSRATGPTIAGVAVYSGYFGAAQGVILVALLGIALPEPLQRVNAAKNVLAAAANGTAALIFVSVAEVSWTAALLIAVGGGVALSSGGADALFGGGDDAAGRSALQPAVQPTPEEPAAAEEPADEGAAQAAAEATEGFHKIIAIAAAAIFTTIAYFFANRRGTKPA